MEKYYGFNFCGESFDFRALVQTSLPVGQIGLSDILPEIAGSVHGLDFKVRFGFIKELGVHNSKVISNAPSKMDTDRLQAFVLKKPGEKVVLEGTHYFINGKKIHFGGFHHYNVTIIEVLS
ncbi:MAG: hypothetical protein V4478_03435 [Patescibacteria group bacterium]